MTRVVVLIAGLLLAKFVQFHTGPAFDSAYKNFCSVSLGMLSPMANTSDSSMFTRNICIQAEKDLQHLVKHKDIPISCVSDRGEYAKVVIKLTQTLEPIFTEVVRIGSPPQRDLNASAEIVWRGIVQLSFTMWSRLLDFVDAILPSNIEDISHYNGQERFNNSLFFPSNRPARIMRPCMQPYFREVVAQSLMEADTSLFDISQRQLPRTFFDVYITQFVQVYPRRSLCIAVVCRISVLAAISSSACCSTTVPYSLLQQPIALGS